MTIWKAFSWIKSFILIQISLTFVPRGPLDNKPALVQVCIPSLGFAINRKVLYYSLVTNKFRWSFVDQLLYSNEPTTTTHKRDLNSYTCKNKHILLDSIILVILYSSLKMHNNWIAIGEHNIRSYQKLLLHRSAHSNNIFICCVMSATWISSSIDDLPHNNCLQYIPRNMHTVFALLCFVVVIHWLIFPYPWGLLHWHFGNLTIAPVPAKQPWWIWINTSCEFIMNDCITTTKQSTTKPCAYFLGYTVIPHFRLSIVTGIVTQQNNRIYFPVAPFTNMV